MSENRDLETRFTIRKAQAFLGLMGLGAIVTIGSIRSAYVDNKTLNQDKAAKQTAACLVNQNPSANQTLSLADVKIDHDENVVLLDLGCALVSSVVSIGLGKSVKNKVREVKTADLSPRDKKLFVETDYYFDDPSFVPRMAVVGSILIASGVTASNAWNDDMSPLAIVAGGFMTLASLSGVAQTPLRILELQTLLPKNDKSNLVALNLTI